MTDPDAFLDESKGFAPGLSWPKKGTTHEGYIYSKRVIADMDPKTKKPKYFENSGDAKKVLVYGLQTEEYDDEIEDDDGKRTLYARWKMLDAIRDARDEAGEDRIEIGGWLSVKFTRQDRPSSPGLSGVKHFEAVYEPPEPGEEADDYLDEETAEEDEPEEEPERPARRRATKAAPKKAAPARRRRAPEEVEDSETEPDEGDEEGYEDEPEEEPERPARRRPAKKAPAKKSAPVHSTPPRRGSTRPTTRRRVTESGSAF
jgi:hypothetical protein